MNRWTILQLIVLLILLGGGYFIEVNAPDTNYSGGVVIPLHVSVLVFVSVMIIFYLLFLIEIKKKTLQKGKSIFEHSKVWDKMPIIVLSFGLCSSLIIILWGEMGNLNALFEDIRALLYIFIFFFYFLMFLFVFSLVRNYQTNKQVTEKTAFYALTYTISISLIILVFSFINVP